MFVSTTGLSTTFLSSSYFQHKNECVPGYIAYTEAEKILTPNWSDVEVSIVGKERGRGEEEGEREDCPPCELEEGHDERAGGGAEGEERHLLLYSSF